MEDKNTESTTAEEAAVSEEPIVDAEYDEDYAAIREELAKRKVERASEKVARKGTKRGKRSKEAKSESGDKEGKGKDKLFPVLLLFWGICLMLLLTMFMHHLGFFHYPWEKKIKAVIAGDLFPGEGEAAEGALEGMTEDDILAQMQKVADAAYFSFKINAVPEFENGKAEGNLEIENPSYNIYPMVVQITLEDTGELIYDSGGIMPNRHIQSDKLKKVLPAGEYRAIAHFYAYDPDTKQNMGEQRAVLNITIH
ncbi:hypothetical protein FACS1894111_02970 [Clostridia bacterium]|nr:hypothetical protein FACS1894111_02970 [Clostridia bacterium]